MTDVGDFQRVPETPARKAARQLVVEAFRDVPYPGDQSIPSPSTARWTARYGERYEGAEVSRLFMGKTWPEVNLELLRHPLGGFHQGALCFLSDEAVGCYAPALMLVALDHGCQADTFLSDAIDIFGTEFGRGVEPLERRVGGYTPRQKAAVAAFLKVMADEEYDGDPYSGPARLLSGRWGEFLPRAR